MLEAEKLSKLTPFLGVSEHFGLKFACGKLNGVCAPPAAVTLTSSDYSMLVYATCYRTGYRNGRTGIFIFSSSIFL